MNGYVFVMGPCLVCKRPFSFNPNRVPSFPIKGNREPICAGCMAVINAKRIHAGEEPLHVHPEAYQPIPEEEL